MDGIDSILRKIYYNPEHAAAYSSAKKLYDAVKKVNKNISFNVVKEWLSSQLVYTLHKSARRKFVRNRVVASELNEEFQADLVDMKKFKSKNKVNGKQVQYILTVIDVLSKFAFAIPLVNKSGPVVAAAFDSIFQERKPQKLKTDAGKEFLNRSCQEIFKKHSVYHVIAKTPGIKCSIAERFNRTLKEKMWKVFTKRGTTLYVDILQKLVGGYNSTKHRSIKMIPKEVTVWNQELAFNNLYGGKSLAQIYGSNVRSKLAIGDTVRRVYDLQVFDKGYWPKWTDHIYTVCEVIKGNTRPMYRIKDNAGNILPIRFYEENLQKVKETVYRVEEVYRERTRLRNGNKEVFVKWLNFPEQYNSWILETDLKDL